MNAAATHSPLNPLDASAISDCVLRNMSPGPFADRVFDAACDLHPRLLCNGDPVLASVRHAFLNCHVHVSRSLRNHADNFVA